jgi:transposase InsO family protein
MGSLRAGSAGWCSLPAGGRGCVGAAVSPSGTSPTRLPQPTIDLIVTLRNDLLSKGLDHGPHTIAWHLEHHHGLTVSVNSIHRHLRAAGLVTPTPQRRPKSSYIRFAAEQPNERWQADFTHWWLADGTHVEILDWIDDHARYALSVTAHRRVTGPIVLAEFRKTVAAQSIPASTLTDNGMVLTTRLSAGRGGRNGFENERHRLGVTQFNSTRTTPPPAARSSDSTKPSKNGSPATPATATLAELQTQLNAFVEAYNHDRPHRSLPHQATPATADTARPKADPANRTDTHNRVRGDRIDQAGVITLRVAGRLHHIGVGRTYTGTRVLVLATMGQQLDQQPQDPAALVQFHNLVKGLVTTSPQGVEDTGEAALRVRAETLDLSCSAELLMRLPTQDQTQVSLLCDNLA